VLNKLHILKIEFFPKIFHLKLMEVNVYGSTDKGKGLTRNPRNPYNTKSFVTKSTQLRCFIVCAILFHAKFLKFSCHT
jgi:hypothetical protein